jgi:hypothetical protein
MPFRLSYLSLQISASSLLQFVRYKPQARAASITCPIVLVVPENDNLCSPSGAEIVAKAAVNGEILKLPGGKSHSPYRQHNLTAILQRDISTYTQASPATKHPLGVRWNFLSVMSQCDLLLLAWYYWSWPRFWESSGNTILRTTSLVLKLKCNRTFFFPLEMFQPEKSEANTVH